MIVETRSRSIPMQVEKGIPFKCVGCIWEHLEDGSMRLNPVAPDGTTKMTITVWSGDWDRGIFTSVHMYPDEPDEDPSIKRDFYLIPSNMPESLRSKV